MAKCTFCDPQAGKLLALELVVKVLQNPMHK